MDKTLWIAALAAVFLLPTAVQAGDVAMEAGNWEVQAREHRFEAHLGRPGLFLQNGAAIVKDAEFSNGTISFDIAVAEQRGFSGAIWHHRPDESYEFFYIRPHQSGKPDAVQYTPDFNGLSAWQLYHGPRYANPVDFTFDQWMPIKIVVSNGKADIYVNGGEKPLVHVDELKTGAETGELGLLSGFAPAWYSNFQFEPAEAPTLIGEAAEERLQPENPILHYEVSSPIAASVLTDAGALSIEDLGNLSWTAFETEPNGIANLARLAGTGKDADTVLVRLRLSADAAVLQRVQFGFSDRVRVYLNGQLLFSGNDMYMTRDFRYLGTIGLHDALYLPLKEGANELVFAVSESFGGWGLVADLKAEEGVTVQP